MKNPFEIHTTLPAFNMGATAAPKPVRVGGIGIHGPWSLDPGSPNFPNHRPYLTNPKPPNMAAQVPSQKIKI